MHLLLLDESGLLMAPLLRRSWAPAGQRPVLPQKAREREKVSVAAALWLTPLRDRLGLAFSTLVNGYFNNEAVAPFVGGVCAGLGGSAVLLWDGGSMHKGDPIDALVEQFGGRLELEPLPPYAPELMPVEQLWSWLKYSRLCNWAPADATQLNEEVVRELSAIQEDQERLRSFFHASDLPLPRALLS